MAEDSANPTPDEVRGMETIRPWFWPDSWVLWNKQVAAARDGRLLPSGCPHPYSALIAYVDDQRKETDKYMRPVNLAECSICHALLTMVDAWGERAADA